MRDMLTAGVARPEGFEPPAFGIGIHCDIQLRHGRKRCRVGIKLITNKAQLFYYTL